MGALLSFFGNAGRTLTMDSSTARCRWLSSGGATSADGRQPSADARQEVGQIEDLLVSDRVQHVRHRGIVGPARVVLVFPQGLHQVVLALAGQAGNALLAGIIAVVAEVA